MPVAACGVHSHTDWMRSLCSAAGMRDSVAFYSFMAELTKAWSPPKPTSLVDSHRLCHQLQHMPVVVPRGAYFSLCPRCLSLITICWRVQVAWSRYLVSFQMELADKKCRPSGSPPRDSGFLNLHLRICAFPTHDHGCKFAAYFQRCAPLRPAHPGCADSRPTG